MHGRGEVHTGSPGVAEEIRAAHAGETVAVHPHGVLHVTSWGAAQASGLCNAQGYFRQETQGQMEELGGRQQ